MRCSLLWLLCVSACQWAPDYKGTHYRCDDGICPAGYTCVAGMCQSGGSGGMEDVAVEFDAPDGPMLSWWDAAWGKRAQLTITNVSTSTLPAGFQIGLPVDIAALDSPTASWDSLRIVRFDVSAQTWTDKGRYVEGGGNRRILWFRLDTPLATNEATGEYYLYFFNPSPTVALSNPATIFDFYESFPAPSVSATTWAIQGTPTITGSELQLKPNDSIRTNTRFGVGYAVTASMSAANNIPRFWVGWQRMTDFVDGDPWLIWITRSTGDGDFPTGGTAGTIWPEVKITGVVSGIDYGNAVASKALDGTKHWYTVQRHSDRVVFRHDGNLAYTAMLPTSYTPSLQIRLSNEGSGNITFGMVNVRKAVYPDPMVVFGAIETR